MLKHTTKNIILLLLAGAFVASVFAHEELNEQWNCVHDKMEHADPELLDFEETGFNEAGEGRLLADTYPNMRMYGYYGLLSGSSSSTSYFKNDLIPPLLSYFEAALKVKYPVSGAFKISSGSVCGVNTPSALRNGVQADFVYMVQTESDGSGNWVASSSSCNLASGSKRPLVGKTTINTALMKPAMDNILLHEKNMICIMHELVHTLGFSSSLFKHFLDSNGKTVRNPVISGRLDGSSNQIVTLSPLKEMIQEHFGCSSVQGAYMENSGSDATAGSHFERRQFAFEAMTSGLVYEMQMSKFTLGMLESSGWYAVDYSYADPFFWGQGQGCEFLTGSCSSRSFDFEEYCTGSSRGCANPGRGGGSCKSDARSDNCKFIHPDVKYDCENPDAESYARLPGLQTFGRNTESKCFMGTLANNRASSETSFCFKYSCEGSGASTVLNIEVGSKTVSCTSAGSQTVSGYAGTVTCPDPLFFCSTVGQKVCPRGCMGRGECVNGKCSCYSGFTGEDCALNN